VVRTRKREIAAAEAMSVDTPSDLRDQKLYLNRELSLLSFHGRVLEEARDPETPLLERLKFLAISCSNLDEFFEIRVAGLREQVAYGSNKTGPDGLSPQKTLERISEEAHRLVADQYRLLNDELLPALAEHGIRLRPRQGWEAPMQKWARGWFDREIAPVLTPIGLDPAHPFPRIYNKSLNFIVSLEGKDAFGRKARRAVVQAPRSLPRMIPVPPDVASGAHDFVTLAAVIHAHIQGLFPGMKVVGSLAFRVTRNSDLWVDEEYVDDLMRALKGELSHRHFGDAVRLELRSGPGDDVADFLLPKFGLGKGDLYRVEGPVNLHRLMEIYDLTDRPDLKYPRFVPGSARLRPDDSDLFEEIRSRDLLLHHPYQSAAPVLDLVRRAASDPAVLAIKMTLYRTGHDSPFVAALLDAARAGKEVTVVVELRARFDEEENIDFAQQLQEAGAKVAYGVVGYKAHTKMLLVVRREPDGLRRYVHLGTGNYHMGTSRAYTDLGLLTCREDVGRDVHELFLQLTGLGRAGRLAKVIQAPFHFHRTMMALVEEEIAEAKEGRPARIIAKMNSLTEPRMIQALYRASEAGVEIDLVVRGICRLRPGVPGVSERIRVRSILGRYLEHSRVFHFHARGEGKTFCSSGDWMERNFFRRVETCFPIEDRELAQRVVDEALITSLADDRRVWLLGPDGIYRRPQPPKGDSVPVSAQEQLMKRLGRIEEEEEPEGEE
jgi:polyphosphate kinase